jgi:ADP-heptose:LPS heptosyltransferase
MTDRANSSANRRVLVFRIGSLGDSLVALPALRNIRREFPDAAITLLTNVPVNGGVKAASSFQVLSGCGLIDDFIEYMPTSRPGPLLHLLSQIWKVRPQHCFYLMPVRTMAQRIRDKVFLVLAGSWKPRGLRLDGKFSQHKYSPDTGLYESEAERLMRSIGLEHLALSHEDFSLGLTPAELDAGVEKLTPGTGRSDIIAVSIGTKLATNEWGQDNWVALLQRLAKLRPRAQLITIGSYDESSRCEELGRIFQGRFVNFCGQLSPRESAAMLAHCSVFIGHDSGPMHLANAVSIPLIGIFSARNLPGIWFPRGSHAHVFYEQVSCRGCELEVCIKEKMRCIRAITSSTVLDQAMLILSGDRTPDYPSTAARIILASTPL